MFAKAGSTPLVGESRTGPPRSGSAPRAAKACVGIRIRALARSPSSASSRPTSVGAFAHIAGLPAVQCFPQAGFTRGALIMYRSSTMISLQDRSRLTCPFPTSIRSSLWDMRQKRFLSFLTEQNRRFQKSVNERTDFDFHVFIQVNCRRFMTKRSVYCGCFRALPFFFA